MAICVATQNFQYAHLGRGRGKVLWSKIQRTGVDIVSLTEVIRPDDTAGHFIWAHGDYGYNNTTNRQKAGLWSHRPFENVQTKLDGAPDGRFISAEQSGIVFASVCIPWRMAHVSTGSKDRKPWDDHIAYLETLGAWIRASKKPLVVMGDFNQAIPRVRQPKAIYTSLCTAFGDDFDFVTANLSFSDKTSIDHISISKSLNSLRSGVISNLDEDSKRLSDHFGVWAMFE